MKVKVENLIGQALDWAVAKCQNINGWNPEVDFKDWPAPSYSTDWSQGGPIIERAISKLVKNVGGTYTAQIRHEIDHPLSRQQNG